MYCLLADSPNLIVYIMLGIIAAMIAVAVIVILLKGRRSHPDGKLENSGGKDYYDERAKEFLKAAEDGDAEAQYKLSQVYEFKESDKYIYWLERAAEQNHIQALRDLADDYNYGNDAAEPPIKKNLKKAVEYLTKLADTGDIAAMKDISLLYAVDFSDDAKAREWVKRAAEAGDVEAMEELGNDYRLLPDVADFDKSEYWYRKAAQAGSGAAMKGIGDLYCYDDNRHDYLQAENWYKKAIAAGYWFAYVRLGDMYREGKGFLKDEATAFSYYKMAADKGDDFGKINVAECYINGSGVERDGTKGVEILKEAAEHSFTAKYRLALCYYDGTGVERDYKRAAELLKQCPDYDRDAMNKLGECYYFGYGVKADREKAHKLWKDAAERECEEAALNLKTYFYESAGSTAAGE